jgi:hypothetical protein
VVVLNNIKDRALNDPIFERGYNKPTLPRAVLFGY